MPLKDESCAVVVICVMMVLYWLTRLERMACEAGSAVGVPVPTRANVPVPLKAAVCAAWVVRSVSVWLALLAVDVNVTEPLLASDAVSPIPAADSAVLHASIELSLPGGPEGLILWEGAAQ